MNQKISPEEFERLLQEAVEKTFDAADSSAADSSHLFEKLAQLASQNALLKPIWEDHLLLESAIGDWKQSGLPLSEEGLSEEGLSEEGLSEEKDAHSLDDQFTKAILNQLKQEDTLGRSELQTQTQTKTQINSQVDWQPLLNSGPLNSGPSSSESALRSGKIRGWIMQISTAVAAVLCFTMAWNWSISPSPQQQPVVEQHDGTNPSSITDDQLGHQPGREQNQNNKKRFSELLHDAGQSYASLAESTVDSVHDDGGGLMPKFSEVQASLQTHQWDSQWWDAQQEKKNASKKPKDSLKSQIQETIQKKSQELWEMMFKKDNRG